MTQQRPPTPEELILAMLREVLSRQAEQMGLKPKVAPPASTPAPAPPPPSPTAKAQAPVAAPPAEFEEADESMSAAEARDLAEFNELAAQAILSSSLPRTLRLLVVGLLVLLILINVPVFNELALARALPDRQALIIRDGLLLKGSGPEVYVLENNSKRWVSSLDAFEHYGYQWDEVHLVDDSFLTQFPDGRPLHVPLKCNDSPHIYRLENDQKRWIKDIPTFEAEGHV